MARSDIRFCSGIEVVPGGMERVCCCRRAFERASNAHGPLADCKRMGMGGLLGGYVHLIGYVVDGGVGDARDILKGRVEMGGGGGRGRKGEEGGVRGEGTGLCVGFL